MTEYFTDSDKEEEGDIKKPWADGRYTPEDGITPHDSGLSYTGTGDEINTDTPNIANDSRCKEESFLNGTSESAHANDVTIDSTRRKRAMRRRLAPILRTAYYGHKRLMGGVRHFVSSVTEYAAGASLSSSSRKIPFYS